MADIGAGKNNMQERIDEIRKYHEDVGQAGMLSWDVVGPKLFEHVWFLLKLLANLERHLDRSMGAEAYLAATLIRAERAEIQLAEVTAEREALLAELKPFREAEVLETYPEGKSGRQWARHAATWLYPGQSVLVVDAAMGPQDPE